MKELDWRLRVAQAELECQGLFLSWKYIQLKYSPTVRYVVSMQRMTQSSYFFSDVRLTGILCHLIERTDACLFRDTYKGNFSDGHRWMTYIPRMSQKHLINSAFKCMLDGSVQWLLTITVVFFFQEYLPFIWLHGPANKMTKGEYACMNAYSAEQRGCKKTNLLENTMKVRIRKCPRATTLPLRSSYTTFPTIHESHVRLLIVVM